MTDDRKAFAAPDVDPERDPATNPFDNNDGFFGQQYSREREQAMGDHKPSGHPLNGDPEKTTQPDVDQAGRNLPPEAGRRGWIDPKSGEVHGSGSGAGGGREGEDFDKETSGGS